MKNPNSFFGWLRNIVMGMPEWIDNRALGLVALVLILVVAMAWSEPLPGQRARSAALALAVSTQTATSAPTLAQTVPPESTPTPIQPTPIPEEWQTNREMGTGIVMGAVALVLIIVGGTLGAIRRK